MSLNSKPRKEIAYAALGLPVIWTAESTLGEWPETGVAISFDNPDGDDVVFSPTSFSVDGRVAIWDLTTEQVATLAGITQWRIQINDAWPLVAGFLSWSDGWTGSGDVQSLGSVVVGPEGPTGVSADAGNGASLGSDGLIWIPPAAMLHATVSPEYPGAAIRVEYPAFMSPRPHVVRVPIESE